MTLLIHSLLSLKDKLEVHAQVERVFDREYGKLKSELRG
jgi:hypothetical protein